MKIAIYSPYLDSFGGGERYILTIAEVLAKGNDVDLLLDQHHLELDPETLISELGKRLNLNLEKVNLTDVPMGRGINFFKRLIFFRKYDILIYLTDGSLFYSTAKHSLVHFQVPFKNTAAKSLWGRLKLSSWQLAICNSLFTKNTIAKEWPIKCQVLYPPVDIEKIKPLDKKKQILSVGRFTSFSKSKKHEEMIKAFSEMYQKGSLKGWSLHLAGSLEGDEGYVDELKEKAKNVPIFFYPNLPFADLMKLYGNSSIYWHAAGLDEDDPTKMEHFGIATVEAMAGGCVPVVINCGGQPEIVEDDKSGFLWDTLDELQKITLRLIGDPKLLSRFSEEAITRSKNFSKNYFEQSLKNLIKEVLG